MGLAETANLIVNLQLKGNFQSQIGKAVSGVNKLDRTASRGYRIGQQIGTGIQRGATLAAVGVGLLATQVVAGLDSLVELERQTAATNAAIKSTKGVAGITAQAVGQLANKYEDINALIGDEVIRSSENMLLTFTNVRKKAFEPTLRAILDLNTAMGRGPGGLQATTIAVGKAMNDPVKGLTSLGRLGVKFTPQQIKRIKTLMKENKLYEAQKIILGELSKEFGGRFAKEGTTTAAKVAKFKDKIEDLQRTLAAGLLPVVSNVADALAKLLSDPAVIAGVQRFGQDLAKVLSKENLTKGIEAVAGFIKTAASFGPGLMSAVKGAASIVGAAVAAFKSLPEGIQKLAIGGFVINKLTGGLLTNIIGGVAGALKSMVTASMNVQAGVVTVNGAAGPGGVVPGGGGSGILGKILAVGAAGAIVAAAVPIGKAFAGALPASLKGEGGKGLSESQTRIANALEAMSRANPPKELQGHLKDLQSRSSETTAAVAALREAAIPKVGEVTTAVQMEKDAVTAAGQATTGKLTTTSAAIQATTRSATLTGANIAAGATRSGSAAIVAAIWAARPVINVNNVTRYTTVQNRYGPGQPSANQQQHHAANGGA